VKVTVKLFAHLSSITETSELQIDLEEGAGPMDLLGELSKRFGPSFVETLYAAEDGPVNPYTAVIVDGTAVLLTERADVELHEGSIVAFLPPLGGG
jgi:molybdopterin converting factor small subunit